MRNCFLYILLTISFCNSLTAQPYLSYEIKEKYYLSSDKNNIIKVDFENDKNFNQGSRYIFTLTNISSDTIWLKNIVPYGTKDKEVYITGKGDHPLSRSHLFLPGKSPVNVVCPDNAWELGYSSFYSAKGDHYAALTRRIRESITKGERRRFETVLYPGGSVKYNFYEDKFTGDWQEGLRLMFQKRFLYDVESFDNSLFERKDLEWIRKSYVMHLIMAWDKKFYNYEDGKFHLDDFVKRGKKLYGGDEVIGIWPTWPSLGLDQRNQFDLFRDLPGGTKQLSRIATNLRKDGSRFFVCYNPWDESTRSVQHLSGLAQLIKETDADGVVLDTRGASSKELQNAADSVRKGVVMYSEGMAVVKDMPGIVSGRVHNALYYVPMLNLNKFIKPDFAIFRVAEIFKEPIQREFATSFFNGYGTELNIFGPGEPSWMEEQYKYLGRTSRILRENTSNFTSGIYTPLIKTNRDSVWVNEWKTDTKTIYTVYSIVPEGFNAPLIKTPKSDSVHYVSLWHHRELNPLNGLLPAEANSFHQKYLGTNNEGEVDCIAVFPKLLEADLNGNNLQISSLKGTGIKVWASTPSYDKVPLLFKPGKHELNLYKEFGTYEGDIIIQLFNSDELIDERIVQLIPGVPRRISEEQDLSEKIVSGVYDGSPRKNQNKPNTTIAKFSAKGMVQIPAGKFIFRPTNNDQFVPYPVQDTGKTFDMSSFLMDEKPVSNKQFLEFINNSRYRPKDTTNYLKHWNNSQPSDSILNEPMVYINYEDAKAYAKWAGKRLPSEIEWQYAAQTSGLNEWPVPAASGKLIDSTGVNPFGLKQLSGKVWQLTNDRYITGSYEYILLKGGSDFRALSSWWYVPGGPQKLTHRQFLLRISPGFERNATVGFRCVK